MLTNTDSNRAATLALNPERQPDRTADHALDLMLRHLRTAEDLDLVPDEVLNRWRAQLVTLLSTTSDPQETATAPPTQNPTRRC